MSTLPPINVCDALKNTGFQSSIARHAREFCWGFDETKITVFDRILPGNPIEAFLEGRCKHTKDWFTHGKARPDALGYRKHLFSQFKTHVNPFTALVRDIKNENGALFYTVLPVGNIVGGDWQEKFRDTMLRLNFTLMFMYGVKKSSYVYIVFGVYAKGRFNISAAGVGKALGRIFTKNHDKSTFTVITCLGSVNCKGGEAWLALAIAHVASLRCTCAGPLHEFNHDKGDIGDQQAAYTVDLIRASSFPYALCGSLSGLLPEDATKRKESVTAKLVSKGLPLPWGYAEDVWTPKQKWTAVVSLLFQSTAVNQEMMTNEIRALAKKMDARLWLSSNEDNDTIGVLTHALLRFPGHINPRDTLQPQLIALTHKVTKCTLMSLTPVEDVPNNLFADAILAVLDPEPSPIRDDLWRTVCPYECNKKTVTSGEKKRKPVPPAPRPVVAAPIPKSKKRLPDAPPAVVVAKKKVRVSEQEQEEEDDSTALLASGYLMGQLLEAEFDSAPGTHGYKLEIEVLVLRIPDWIFQVKETDHEHVGLRGDGAARAVMRQSMLSCLKILADAMYYCSKALFYASLSFVEGVSKGHNTVQAMHDDLFRAHEHCRGVEPVINSFRFIESGVFEDVGVKKKGVSDSTTTEAPPKLLELPKPVASMNTFNLLKRIYAEMLRAHGKLNDMWPDDGLVVDWDGHCRAVGELKDILFEGMQHCSALLDFLRMEGTM